MSAINVIQQTDATHLVTDGASYARDGTIVDLCEKVFVLPAARCAYTMRGRTSDGIPEILHYLESLEEVLELMPILSKVLHRKLHAVEPQEIFEPLRNFEIVIAGWSTVRERPEAWALATRRHEIDDIFMHVESFEPYTLYELPILVTAPGVSLSALFGSLTSMADVDALDPESAALALLEAQRAKAWTVGDRDIHCVGGFGDLTTIDRDGVRTRRIVEWPDKPGKPIDPTKARL